jgi:hypothetical protein
LGFANYFRSFIPNFSVRVANMEKLLSPKVPFVWSEQHDVEFVDEKKAIVEAGMLHTVDYD